MNQNGNQKKKIQTTEALEEAQGFDNPIDDNEEDENSFLTLMMKAPSTDFSEEEVAEVAAEIVEVAEKEEIEDKDFLENQQKNPVLEFDSQPDSGDSLSLNLESENLEQPEDEIQSDEKNDQIFIHEELISSSVEGEKTQEDVVDNSLDIQSESGDITSSLNLDDFEFENNSSDKEEIEIENDSSDKEKIENDLDVSLHFNQEEASQDIPPTQATNYYETEMKDFTEYEKTKEISPSQSEFKEKPIPGDKQENESLLMRSETLSLAQKRISDLENEIEDSRLDIEKLYAAGETLKNRNSKLLSENHGLKNKIEASSNISGEEKQLLRGALLEKDKIIEDLKLKNGEMNMRVSSSVKKIRTRERELENLLEISKSEKEALLRDKDNIILDLKKKVDNDSMEINNFSSQARELNKKLSYKESLLLKIVKTLSLSLAMIEGGAHEPLSSHADSSDDVDQEELTDVTFEETHDITSLGDLKKTSGGEDFE